MYYCNSGVSKCLEKWQNGLTALIILAAGYASRMTVSLSPTIYASGLRTYTPLILSFTIVSLLLLIESQVI